MPIYFNLCMKCDNYLTAKTCIAYPKGIPNNIWENKVSHKKNIKGDNGYKFISNKGTKKEDNK